MTIIEMHAMCDLLIDKANSAWFTPAEKDLYLNLAQIEYLDNNYRLFEVNEEVREKLLPLVRKNPTIAGPATSINLSSIANFRYVLNLKGSFQNGCGGTWVKAIPPVQLDDEVANQEDPFNKNDDEYPGYTQENNGTSNLIQIISTNAATNLVLKYLITPPSVLNDLTTPANNVNCLLSPSAHEEIVNIAVRKMLGTVQDQLGYQIQDKESQIQ